MSRESIRARVAAATEGPWQEALTESRPHWVAKVGQWLVVSKAPPLGTVKPDAIFIAHARQDIPALLAVADAAALDLDRCDACRTNPVAWGPIRGYCAVHEATGGALDALEALP